MNRVHRAARVTLALAFVAGLVACASDTAGPNSPSLTVTGSSGAPPVSGNLLTRQNLVPALSADGGTVVGDPSKVKIGLYGLYLSEQEDCSAPVTVTDNGSTAVVKDFAEHPVLFTGSPAAGTYKCVILRISDAMHFESASAGGACQTNTDYAMDIYRAPDDDWKDINADTIFATGSDTVPSDDKVYIFASVNPTAVLARGMSPHQTLQLTGSLTVPGSATFYWNATNSIGTDGTECGMNPPQLSFH